MGRSLIDRIQAKLEFFRLEQHYTRRRHRRSTFVSNAVYIDGEYVYQTPSNTGTSTDSASTRVDALHGERVGIAKSNSMAGDMPSLMFKEQLQLQQQQQQQQPVSSPMPRSKRLVRFGSMPSFNGSTATTQSSASSCDRRPSAVQWLDEKR